MQPACHLKPPPHSTRILLGRFSALGQTQTAAAWCSPCGPCRPTDPRVRSPWTPPRSAAATSCRPACTSLNFHLSTCWDWGVHAAAVRRNSTHYICRVSANRWPTRLPPAKPPPPACSGSQCNCILPPAPPSVPRPEKHSDLPATRSAAFSTTSRYLPVGDGMKGLSTPE